MIWYALPALPAIILLITLTAIMVAFACDINAASIGGTFVPDALRCTEDSVIAFVGVDTLDCVHIDALP